jgi:hypothetical protein
MPEDPLLQLTHLRPGLQAEFVNHPAACRLERRQGIRLAPRPVQRKHQRRHQPLPQRMVSHQPLKLGH